ncbi:hypothetical protein K2Z83_20400 [Oscillochloris sp. ZM17-4]|uniref:hypothetical protein n=1 Tax=Oscillochloris sp. ZM17-4 TaxID=2866714 RepID=UPI001C73D942|nr:hypothetical protein [Oscillochloris sp. ZM17-4]MBX0330033.1 hypothetical protein [Oscillochloris sp. ZM17-4]
MHASLRRAGRTRRRDDRRLHRLGRVLNQTILIESEEAEAAISTARRAAELLQLYYRDIYTEYIEGLAVTPTTLRATAGLFLSLADRDLLDLQPWWAWGMGLGVEDPLVAFTRRCAQPATPSALLDIFESRANIWEPAPMCYGLDLEQLYEHGPDDENVLVGLLWRLWHKNPIFITYFGHITPDRHTELIANAEICARISALEPLPMLDIPEVREAFWQHFAFDIGGDDGVEALAADVLTYPLGLCDNIYAAYSVEDVNENWSGNFGIDWTDTDHVLAVGAQQREGRAIAVGFWELSRAFVAHPPLITQLGEAMHALAAEAIANHTPADLAEFRRELAALRDRMENDDAAEEEAAAADHQAAAMEAA